MRVVAIGMAPSAFATCMAARPVPLEAAQMLGGLYIGSSEMYYPKVYNIEMDPQEDLNVGGVHI